MSEETEYDFKRTSAQIETLLDKIPAEGDVAKVYNTTLDIFGIQDGSVVTEEQNVEVSNITDKWNQGYIVTYVDTRQSTFHYGVLNVCRCDDGVPTTLSVINDRGDLLAYSFEHVGEETWTVTNKTSGGDSGNNSELRLEPLQTTDNESTERVCEIGYTPSLENRLFLLRGGLTVKIGNLNFNIYFDELFIIPGKSDESYYNKSIPFTTYTGVVYNINCEYNLEKIRFTMYVPSGYEFGYTILPKLFLVKGIGGGVSNEINEFCELVTLPVTYNKMDSPAGLSIRFAASNKHRQAKISGTLVFKMNGIYYTMTLSHQFIIPPRASSIVNERLIAFRFDTGACMPGLMELSDTTAMITLDTGSTYEMPSDSDYPTIQLIKK